jgi:DNA-binding Xre family transcriptional regulator
LIKLKLGELIAENEGKVTPNALAREAKVRPNGVYEMCKGETKRVDLATLDKLISTLEKMIGRDIDISEVIEYKKEERQD